MKNKSVLLFLFIISLFSLVSCKKEYDPEERDLRITKTADSLVKLGYAKFYSKDFQAANDFGNQAISIKPGYSRANVLIGNVQIEVGNYSIAIERFTFAIGDPGTMQHYEFEKVYQKRAFAKEGLEDYRGALADYNILIDSFGSRYGYYHRGVLKYNFLDDANGACSDWSVAGEKGYGRAYDLIAKFCSN